MQDSPALSASFLVGFLVLNGVSLCRRRVNQLSDPCFKKVAVAYHIRATAQHYHYHSLYS
jgi:hypothetical protein